MAGADPEIDQRLTLTRRIPLADIVSSQLELQGSSDSIMGLKLVISRLLPMLVHVDKARRHHQPACVDVPFAGERSRGYCANPAIAYAHVADRIQSRLGIHYNAPRDHHVIRLAVGRGARQRS